MKRLMQIVCLMLLCHAGTDKVWAQVGHEGMAAQRLKHIRAAYAQFVPTHQLLSRGQLYAYFYPQASGDPYLDGQAQHEGYLVYDGLLYESISLGYDVYNDLVYVSSFEQGGAKQLILNEEKIRHFSIKDRLFVRLTAGEVAGLEAGMYELAYAGTARRLLIKRHKDLIRDSNNAYAGKSYKFVQRDRYYLVSAGVARLIQGKKDLLRSFENPDEIAAFMRKNQIHLNARLSLFKHQLVEVLKYVEAAEKPVWQP